jgi:hypothetical protein
MGGVLVRRGCRLVSVNLDEDNVSGLSAIAQHIESHDARLVSTGNRVLLRSGKKGIKLIGHHRNVDVNKKEAVRHELTLFDDPTPPHRGDGRDNGVYPGGKDHSGQGSKAKMAQVRSYLISGCRAVSVLEAS